MSDIVDAKRQLELAIMEFSKEVDFLLQEDEYKYIYKIKYNNIRHELFHTLLKLKYE
jgi:hypothetical protein